MDDVRVWLRANGYAEIADDIDAVMSQWRLGGKATRRNWWEILAGKADGSPRKVAGREWPVLAAFRARQGLDPMPHALSRTVGEEAPPPRVTNRWQRKES
jgi:hypothetical protein